MTRLMLGVLTLGVLSWWLFSGKPVAKELPTPVEKLASNPEIKSVKPIETMLPKARPVERVIDERPVILTEAPSFTAPEPGDWRTLPLSTSFSTSKGWSNWLCADLEGTPSRSLWRLQDSIDDKSEIHPGTCEDWDRKNIATAVPNDSYFPDDVIN